MNYLDPDKIAPGYEYLTVRSDRVGFTRCSRSARVRIEHVTACTARYSVDDGPPCVARATKYRAIEHDLPMVATAQDLEEANGKWSRARLEEEFRSLAHTIARLDLVSSIPTEALTFAVEALKTTVVKIGGTVEGEKS